MTVQVELWQLITLLLSFLGSTATFGKVLLDQVEKRLDERHEAQEKARQEGERALADALRLHLEQEQKTAAQLQSLERDFLNLRADLPLQYVRREDYIRGQSVIEAKLDALYNKLELVQLRGAKND